MYVREAAIQKREIKIEKYDHGIKVSESGSKCRVYSLTKANEPNLYKKGK